jgi:HEAT repeat protein
MPRILLTLVAFAALPALALFGIETDPKKIEAQWHRESMETLARGSDAKERAKAAEWLGGRGDAASIAALGAALSDREAAVRQAAASALWKSEKAALPARAALEAALDDADPNVVARVAGALQAVGVQAEALVPARKRVFAAPGATLDSRFLVARNLIGHEPAPALVEPMHAYLTRSAAAPRDSGRHNTELARKALERIAKAQDRAAIPPLAAAAREDRPGRAVVLETLALYNPRPEGYLALLLDALDAKQAPVRSVAVRQLGALTAEADVAAWVPRAAGLLADPDAAVRSTALGTLGRGKGLAAGEIERVVAALSDRDPQVRRSAADAIGSIGERHQAIPAATMARVEAAARPALTAAMEKDPDADVRKDAKWALGKLGGGEQVAAAAPTAPAAESGGMALLRARKITFEEGSYFRALAEADVDVVRAFLDAGMSPKAPVAGMGGPIRAMLFGGNACNPQTRPTKAASKAVVKMLLERGADAEGADAHGNTALMEAASKGCDRELIGMLLRAGAKVGSKNAAGLTPFEMGLYLGHDGLEELIAAGYRLPPEKVKAYAEGYKASPAALAMIRKASGGKK